MKVPGFTAEASLYKSTHHYAIATYAAESALNAAVQPQWSPPISWCGPCADGMRRCIMESANVATTRGIAVKNLTP